MKGILKNKKSAYSCLVAVILVIIALLINYNYSSLNTCDAQYKKIQKVFLERVALIDTVFNEFDNYIETQPNAEYLYFNSKHFAQGDISFFIYDAKDILYWSDSKTPLQEIINIKQNDTSGVINLKSGIYFFKIHKKETFSKIGLLLLQNQYRYENKYLHNNISPLLSNDKSLVIGKVSENYNVKDNYNNELFSITKKESPLDENSQLILLILYLLILIFILISIDSYTERLSIKVVIIGIIIILRIISYYFHYPNSLYLLSYFHSQYFVFAPIKQSIADILINLIIILYTIQLLTKSIFKSFYTDWCFTKKIWTVGSITMSFIIFFANIYLIDNIISNSQLNYDVFSYLTEGDWDYEIFPISILILLVSLIIYHTANISSYIAKNTSNKSFLINILVINTFFAIIISLSICVSYIILLILYSIILIFLRALILKNYRGIFIKQVLFITIMSAIFAFIINVNNNKQEINYRKNVATKLADEHDPLAEFYFIDLRTKILDDEMICTNINNTESMQQLIKKRLQQKYFNGYFLRYDFQITICNPNDMLLIKHIDQQKNCIHFFKDIVKEYGINTICPDLFFLDYGTGRKSYLAILEYPHVNYTSFLFIEFDSKVIAKDPGYPDLLMNKELHKEFGGISKYSYAKYKNNELAHRYGNYFYDTNIKQDYANNDEIKFFNENNYSHLIYNVDKNNKIIVSIKEQGIVEYITPFTIVFIFLLSALAIYYLLYNRKRLFDKSISLKDKIRLYMIFIVICSLLAMMFVTISFINNNFEHQNNKELKTKIQTILTELEQTFAQQSNITDNDYDYFSEHIIKLSNLFATDINMYDNKGNLLISSRPQIFEEGFESQRLNPNVLRKFKNKTNTLIITNENIGKLKYTSAYIPVRNYQNKNIAYLNIPYFSKETDIKKELYSFIVTTINIYAMLIMIAIILAVFITSKITEPLSLIKDKLKSIKIGSENEKIEWKQQDEIGELIGEYNKLVDQIIVSTEKLAKSERESAWKEMARQIAHEIKNPLTPMKLNLQYLQKIIIDKNENWENKFNKSANSIIEQIDNIAVIANKFDDFAKLHSKAQKEKIILKDFIYQLLDLYLPGENLQFNIVNINVKEDDYIIYDKAQLTSVFNNLLKNASNALCNVENALIEIIMIKKQKSFEISIEDNGPGIPDELKEKIFSPYFTTKTHGTGLGLAIVKTIIENNRGEISYSSEPFVKTKFVFTIPIIPEALI